MGGVVYLLDSNVLSEPTKPQPDPRVLELLKERAQSLAMSALTWHELLYGCHRLPEGKRKERLLGYFQRTVAPYVPIFEFTEEMAEWLPLERARLSVKGLSKPFIDGQIAATAAVNGLVLVTRNAKDFADYDGLEVENWFKVFRTSS